MTKLASSRRMGHLAQKEEERRESLMTLSVPLPKTDVNGRAARIPPPCADT